MTNLQADSKITSIPQRLSIGFESKNVSINLFGNSKSDTKDKLVQGMVIMDENKPGTLAYAYCVDSADEIKQGVTIPYQQVTSQIISSHSETSNKNIKFSLPHINGDAIKERAGQIMMTITPVLGNNSSNETKKAEICFLNVAPGSISIAPSITITEAEKLASNGIVSTIACGVITAIPHLATAGYNIYKELTNPPKKSENSENGIFTTLGSLADVAVPFIAALLPF